MAAGEIDQLIDEGLDLYGQGDIDGALVAWQQALLIDPSNEQLISYVDYVRDNYDVLMKEIAVDNNSDGVPFAIGDDEPDYQIEIIPGEIEDGFGEPAVRDSIDSGWYIAADDSRAGTESDPPRASEMAESGLTLELDGEPPPAHAGEISFEDATREYPGGPPRTRTPGPTSDFAAEITPGSFEVNTPSHGFSEQSTPVRERALGFVKPRTNTPPDRLQASSQPPESKRSLLGPNLEAFDREQEALDIEEDGQAGLELATVKLGPQHASALVEPQPDDLAPQIELQASDSGEQPGISYEDPTMEKRRDSFLDKPPLGPEALDSLLDELPRPTPAPQVPRLDLAPLRTPTAAPTGPASTSSTRDLPGATRPPGPPSQPPPNVPAIHTAPTRELERPIAPNASTRDFGKQRTDELPNPFKPPPGFAEPPDTEPTARRPAVAKADTNPPRPFDVAAPTRDLGLRQAKQGSDDEPTVQAFARSLRGSGREDATRADVVLPFDPIDARSAQILDEIDELAPSHEEPEERTRRRITTLFDRAAAWNRAGEHDKAVTAIDLALSEDPSSALAQKLIHRNRETMQAVFAGFLGDLERQPALARPLHELASAPISPRAAFLLSRVDGSLSLDEILDVSGMPRLEASRYLCQLFLRGILR